MPCLTKSKLLRLKRNLFAKDVSNSANVPYGRFKNWDCGSKNRYLTADEVQRIATVLDVPPHEIATDKGAPIYI